MRTTSSKLQAFLLLSMCEVEFHIVYTASVVAGCKTDKKKVIRNGWAPPQARENLNKNTVNMFFFAMTIYVRWRIMITLVYCTSTFRFFYKHDMILPFVDFQQFFFAHRDWHQEIRNGNSVWFTLEINKMNGFYEKKWAIYTWGQENLCSI